MGNSRQSWHWDKLEKMYPLNPKWEEEGWSCPRWLGTGRKPVAGRWKRTVTIHDKGRILFQRKQSSPILPESVLFYGEKVSFLFDDQYVYTADSADPDNSKHWFPYARAPQRVEWNWRSSYRWNQYHNGRFCFLPTIGEKLWAPDQNAPPADPGVVALVKSSTGHCGACLQNVWLSGADLNYVHMQAINLKEAYLQCAQLRKTHMEHAQLKHAHLEGAHLREAKLQWAHLRYARLEGAQLSHTRLDCANLHHAHFEGADLSRASLVGANLQGAHFDQLEMTRPYAEGVRQVVRQSARLSNADVMTARLDRVVFSSSALISIKNLDKALLTDISLDRCRLESHQFDNGLLTARIADVLAGERRDEQVSEEIMQTMWVWEELIQGLKNSTSKLRRSTGFWTRLCSCLVPKFISRSYLFMKHPENYDLGRDWLSRARESYNVIKKCYIDSGKYDDAAMMVYLEKEMERKLNALEYFAVLAGIGNRMCTGMERAASRARIALTYIREFHKWAIEWAKKGEQESRRNYIEHRRVDDRLAARLMGATSSIHVQGKKRQLSSKPLIVYIWEWLRLRWKMNGFIFYRISSGYGERPHYLIGSLLVSVTLFAAIFFFIGTPVLTHATDVSDILNQLPPGHEPNEHAIAWLDPPEPEEVYGWPDLQQNGFQWARLVTGVGQAYLLSLESISTLGFFWLSESKHSWRNFVATLECLWGVYLVALFVWSVGRRLSAR